jgi:hypothetical protein
MKKRSNTILAVLLASCLSLNSLASTIIVSQDGTGNYLTIQDAIDVAQDGDTVLVQDGIYAGTGNRDINFKGKTITVKSENGPEKCIVDCQGTEQEPHRGFKFISGESNFSILSGVTIINGYAPEDLIPSYGTLSVGGAISCSNSNPTIRLCIITNNNAVLHGGGIFAFNSNIKIIDCNIKSNLIIGGGKGGGIYCHTGEPQIINCKINGNSAKSGGGISCNENGSHTKIVNCAIRGNIARSERKSFWGGGGILCDLSSPTISHCLIENNAGSTGGGLKIYRAHSDVLIENCIIRNNEVFGTFNGGGGGIMAECFGCTTTIMNSLITGNTVNLEYSRGGGVYASSGSFIISNCTVSDNSAYNGGGMYISNAETLIDNCILWDNDAVDNGQEISFHKKTVEIQYSTIEGGEDGIFPVREEDVYFWGDGNLDGNPLFINPVENDFRLMSDSPCIDTGNPDSDFPTDATDLDGNHRVDNGIVDMGAYEFIHTIKVAVDIKPQSCPNPVNVKSRGVLPVAILGSDVLDVNDIDFDSILFEGIAPLRGSYDDVASPVADDTECACTTDGADGYMDLTLKFKTQEIASALGEVVDDEMWMLHLTGNLKDGTPIEGTDCIIIKKINKLSSRQKSDKNSGLHRHLEKRKTR